METDSTTKGRGSFWLSRKTIEVLLSRKATATQIGACLVIARFTDAGGRFSSAGIKVIKAAMGIGDAMAERAVNDLQTITPAHSNKQLLYPPEKWIQQQDEQIPERPIERARIRWVINDYKAAPADRIWFSNELVDGYGQFRQPLRRLKQCGDVASRLLLKLYEQNAMEQWGGIRPYPNICHEFTMENKGAMLDFNLWHAIGSNDVHWNVLRTVVMGEASKSTNSVPVDDVKTFWDALKALKSCGFIYETIVVLDREVTNPDAQPVCVLDTKNQHGDTPKGEEGLGGETARLAGKLGHPVTDKNGRFYGTYAAIVPTHIAPHVAGIYRLRFRVTNPLNHGVMPTWARIRQIQEEAGKWIEIVSQFTAQPKQA